MSEVLLCGHCGAPRRDGDRACAFCKGVFADAPTGRGAPGASAGVPQAIILELDRGNLIEAIKLYRDHFKTGLREAKEAVDALAAQRGRG